MPIDLGPSRESHDAPPTLRGVSVSLSDGGGLDDDRKSKSCCATVCAPFISLKTRIVMYASVGLQVGSPPRHSAGQIDEGRKAERAGVITKRAESRCHHKESREQRAESREKREEREC